VFRYILCDVRPTPNTYAHFYLDKDMFYMYNLCINHVLTLGNAAHPVVLFNKEL